MAVLIDKDTKLVVSGITGREGTFHATNNQNYGTNDVEGRRLLAEAALEGLYVEATMLDAANRVVELAKSGATVEA